MNEKTTIAADRGGYTKTRSASGSTSFRADDAVANVLDGATLDEVKNIAKGMGVEDINKYDHLNPGQVRMNLGNRLRGAVARINKANAKLIEAAAKEDATKEAKSAAKGLVSGEDRLNEVSKPVQEAIAGRAKEAKAIADAKAKVAAEKAKEKEAKKATKEKAAG